MMDLRILRLAKDVNIDEVSRSVRGRLLEYSNCAQIDLDLRIWIIMSTVGIICLLHISHAFRITAAF